MSRIHSQLVYLSLALLLAAAPGALQAGAQPAQAHPGLRRVAAVDTAGAKPAAAAKPATRAAAKPDVAAQPEAQSAASSADPEYLIGPGDVLAIDVWHEPEISRSLPVRPDGRLSLPLAGELRAQGLTTDQLAAQIAQRLKKYMDHPAVTVMVTDAQSRRFNILDMVNHPGSFPLNHPTTVLDAIAEAGGLRDFAHEKKIYVIRKRASDGVEIRFNFNYDQVQRGLHMEQNILLQPNDTVVVP